MSAADDDARRVFSAVPMDQSDDSVEARLARAKENGERYLRSQERAEEDEDKRAAEEAHCEFIDDLIDERGGVSTDDLARWTLARPEGDQVRLLRRLRSEMSAESQLESLFPGIASGRRLGAFNRLNERLEREAADRLYDQMNGTKVEPPDVVSLTAFLEEPDEDVRYRVDGLWPVDGRIVLAAQNKSGKTTLTGNLIRSLADGDDFVGRFAVEPVARVVLLDNEMSPSQIRRWLRDQGIRNTDAVEVVTLRGRLSSFNILDPEVRKQWAERIGPADVAIFDCLRPALDALGLSEDKDAGRFLEALDEFVTACAIPELLVVHHMGHSNERSRGDSRLEDWPDAKWKIVKENADDPNSPRYFQAFGRDVDQSEVRLHFNEENRHLTVDGGSRKQATVSRIEADVTMYITANPGCGTNEIRDSVTGDDAAKRQAIRALVSRGDVAQVKVGQKHTHYLSGEEPQNVEN
ncbi:AAA family ATPase [Nocardioides sp. SYSU D00038]|uniref:ATP-binding protein n=1 Tax=Nocardioides sp. SYSU D00038 TaxID=2812554 RepID=UPI001967491E|nr:AAA family ATPase [Nocardioides sp. SYSU D00038]